VAAFGVSVQWEVLGRAKDLGLSSSTQAWCPAVVRKLHGLKEKVEEKDLPDQRVMNSGPMMKMAAFVLGRNRNVLRYVRFIMRNN
jgi:hypothetical protein